MELLCGNEKVERCPLEPYADIICEFLNEFSYALRSDPHAKHFADVMTFAFWVRAASIQRRKENFYQKNPQRNRLGMGVVFHITPSNVPVNFIYSYVFGLLAGNSNVVRLPGKDFPQVECICKVLNSVLQNEKYDRIKKMTAFIRYGHDRKVTDALSQQCNIRVIWGGDNTISEIRKSPLPPRSTEITFADRYSFGIISCKKVSESSDEELEKLAQGFYNDTFLMDQNACSSPHLICWKQDGMASSQCKKIQKRFWNHVVRVARNYDLSEIKVSEKYVMLCNCLMDIESAESVSSYGNLLNVVCVKEIKEDYLLSLRGKFGLFFDFLFKEFNELDFLSTERVQTCVYFGIQPDELLNFIIQRNFMGIDRIVPFGKALDIDVEWDGYDLVAQMSRVIKIEE